MSITNDLAVVAAAASIRAGWLAMDPAPERTLKVFERERVRLGIDSDEYAWRVLSAATASVASAAFWMSALVHIGASLVQARDDPY